jgi:hypothetical protein
MNAQTENATNEVVWNNSIYIPTIYKSIRKEDLWEFLEKEMGKVSHIDFVDLNKNCRRAFVYFSEWYMDKGFGKTIRHNIETRGFCEFSMPIPNKYRKWFKGKLKMNKNPLSATDRKFKWMNVKINNLKNKVDKLEELLLEKNENCEYEYECEDKGPMHISELELKAEEKEEREEISDRNEFYSNTRFGMDERCGWDRW